MAGKWIQKSTERMKKKGTEGSFTRIANRMGMSTKEAASHIMADKEDYPKKTVKKANWARNVAK